MLPNDISETVRRALDEDVGSGDLTAALIPEQAQSQAVVICREEGVLCGVAWFDEVFRQLDPAITIDWHLPDGVDMDSGQLLCHVRGRSRAILTGERTALNFLQMLSGAASRARRFAKRVADLPVEVLDTRKTLPGLRAAQKYAVRCGGCSNHRMGLYDGILIKENHIAVCGSIGQAIRQAHAAGGEVAMEVEVEDLAEMRAALAAGASLLLLDNFDLAALREAVALAAGRAKLEASGNITLDNIRAVAETGVDRISVGALTKDVRAIDLSMRISAPAVAV